eukprot:1872333-Prorocentrum_lima.AAC.1
MADCSPLSQVRLPEVPTFPILHVVHNLGANYGHQNGVKGGFATGQHLQDVCDDHVHENEHRKWLATGGETKMVSLGVHECPAIVVPPLPPVDALRKCVALKHVSFMSSLCQGMQAHVG